jgi:transposase
VVANVSNFVPKPQTPYQWQGMQRPEYFRRVHQFLRRNRRLRCVELKLHDIETSWLEGVLCRGDRRVGEAIELAWQRGARFDAWAERLDISLWRQALSDAGVDVERLVHLSYPADAVLPWDHITIRQGRAYLERERDATGCMDV